MNIYEELNKIDDTESLDYIDSRKLQKELERVRKLIKSCTFNNVSMRDVDVTVKPNNAGTQVHIHFEDDNGLTHYGTIENEDVVSVYEMPSTQDAVKFLEKTISWDKPFKARNVEESLKEDTYSSSKSTKDRVNAAKQIISDLESKGFVNSDIAAIGTMIKETIDSRYPEYVSPRDRLKKAFPDFDI